MFIYIYIESLGWLSVVLAAIVGSVVTFVLARYISARRKIELIRVDEIYRDILGDGQVYLKIPFVVRYEGPEIVPLPTAEWIPKRRENREFLSVQRAEREKTAPAIVRVGPRKNWMISELRPYNPRDGLKLYPGETVTLEVSLIFPPTVWQQWKGHPIPGKIRLQYGRRKFLTFEYDIVL